MVKDTPVTPPVEQDSTLPVQEDLAPTELLPDANTEATLDDEDKKKKKKKKKTDKAEDDKKGAKVILGVKNFSNCYLSHML